MTHATLELPARASKPRRRGLTMVIDRGLPLTSLRGLVESAEPLVDLVKFGWGTALVSCQLEAKVSLLQEHHVDFFLGGTLFEKYLFQERFEEFRALLHGLGAHHVEVSNGTIPLSNSEKAGYVRKLADEFTVLSEVGSKDPGRSEMMPPSAWVQCIQEDLDSGASIVILEARESGRSGICRPNGALRSGLVEEIAAASIDQACLLFEAPNTALQAHLVRRLGPDVNLGNIAPDDVIPLETLRLGLRSDTLTAFEEPAPGSVAGPGGA